MDKHALTKRIKLKALELGFSSVGCAPCEDFADYAAELNSRPDYTPWINSPGTSYLLDGCFPSQYYPEGKSIICCTYGFGDIDFPEELTRHIGRAYLARAYRPTAQSMAGRRVTAFQEYIKSLGVGLYEGGIDVPQRMACARAGIVTYGKNNFARTEEDGTFIILYTYLVDAELEYGTPTIESPCPERCTLCIDKCPMDAIAGPARLQPMRCVLKCNLAPQIDPSLRDALEERIHGCDVCQEVCPRNRAVMKRASRKDPFIEQLRHDFDLEKILLLDDDYYRDVVYPIMYNYITDMNVFRRNAAIALGNSGDAAHIPALEHAITAYPDGIVAEAAQWAIDKLRD